MQDLMELLIDQYHSSHSEKDGDGVVISPLAELDAKFSSQKARLHARMGIEHFAEFARSFLAEHPPQNQIMLAEGFGVTLAGCRAVTLAPVVDSMAPGELEHTPVYPVTEGMSIRGQGGMQSSSTVAVTSGQLRTALPAPPAES